MRQVGIVAAAGIYALNNNVERLADDHRHAQLIADALSSCSWIQQVGSRNQYCSSHFKSWL